MCSRFVVCLRVVMFVSAGGGFCFGADRIASDVSPPGEYIGLGSADHAGVAAFEWGEPVVGTSYFYWYDIDSKAHIIDGDGTDALTTHPVDMDNISFNRVGWHRGQLVDMIDAGIDFLMPVYWGVPGKYGAWSFRGIGPLVAAHDALLKEGRKPPAIGLFYDTSILRHNGYGAGGASVHIDLSTDFGKDWFYTAMRDFFSMVPSVKWARVDGKPIVFLYAASFAKGQDPAVMDYVRGRFKKDFGVEPFIVKHRDWQGTGDAIYQWGGAVSLQIDRHVAAIGPGYDHSAVPGRQRLVVDRREGQTYRDRWGKLLASSGERRPWMVHVETWNEWHEGTDIAHSREYGRTYIELTRKYAELWRRGVQIPFEGRYTKSREVGWRIDDSQGVRIRPSGGDGVWKEMRVNDVACAVAAASDISDGRYLYFDVDDTFVYDADATLEVRVRYLDDGCDGFQIQYDNADPLQGSVQGAFRSGETVAVGNSGKWKTATMRLGHCRFVNRCNQADLRLAVGGGELSLAVSEIRIGKTAND